MPVSYTVNSGLLQLVARGGYSPEDIPRSFLAGLAHEACPTPVGLMLDVRESDVLAERDPKQIRLVAEFLKPYAERIGRRCAIVAASDIHFGLSRMGAVFCESIGVDAQVFRTPEEALAWLRPRSGESPMSLE